MKPQLIVQLEKEFGNMIWQNGWIRYTPCPEDTIKLFRLFNQYVFNNKLESIRTIFKALPDSNVVAAFAFGACKGNPVSIHVFNTANTSFFKFMNSLVHELIHYYDWTTGPLNRMFELYTYLKVDNDMSEVNVGHPTQWVYGAGFANHKRAYDMGSRTYDVHGTWFWRQANKFNDIGFDVADVYDQRMAKSGMRHVELPDSPVTEDIDEMPLDLRNLNDDNPIRHMYDLIQTTGYKNFYFKDPENWYIEII